MKIKLFGLRVYLSFTKLIKVYDILKDKSLSDKGKLKRIEGLINW